MQFYLDTVDNKPQLFGVVDTLKADLSENGTLIMNAANRNNLLNCNVIQSILKGCAQKP